MCSLPVQEGLAEQHFDMDLASKMRNNLREDALDRERLILIPV